MKQNQNRIVIKLRPSKFGRLTPFVMLVAIIAITGSTLVYISHAAGGYPSSGKIVDQNGSPRPGIVLVDCNGRSTTTNAAGVFSFDFSQYQGYCIRISSLPQYVSNPVATNKRPEAASDLYYEWQVAGAQCYHNYQYCGNGKIGGNDAVITHDLSPESLFNFTVSYNPPIPSNPPPSNPPLSNPPPSSGGGGGSSSPPPSSGGGGEGSTLPSGGSSSSGGSSGSRSSGGNSSSTAIPGVTGGSPSTNSSTPDSSPPTTPTNFNATEDPDNKVVDLNWDASTDDTAVKGYRLERQANDGTWQTLSDTITGTSYQDDSATFGSANNYRLQAFDDSGNVSDYATASVTTDTFEANALQNSDAFINSKDNTVTVTIPSGALSEDAFCTLPVATDILTPNVSGYQLISGPYELVCRDSSGATITSFNGKALTASIALNKIGPKKVKTASYFGNKGDRWDPLKITSHDGKSNTDHVNLADYQTFAIMQKQKHTSVWLVLLWIVLVLAALGVGVLLFLRFNLRRKLERKYDEYLYKSRGF